MITQTELKYFSDTREERARAILEKGNPETIDEFTYLVPSQNSEKKYHVIHLDSYSCECEDFKRRCLGQGLYCKHIKALILFQKIKNSYEVESTPLKSEIDLIVETPKQNICPYCQCEQIFRRGVRQTQTGEKQLYCCKNCKRRFVLEPVKNIKGNAKLVCLAMDCYYKGLSYRDISDQFKQFYGLSISHVSIRSWILRFSQVMEKYSEKLIPNTSGVWNADETLILTKKGSDSPQRGEKDYVYVWNVIDNKTKFLLASNCTGHARGAKEAQETMTQAYKQNGKIPNQIITDKLASYQDGIRKTFRNWGRERKVKHTSILGHRREINNNAIESHHTHQKEFHKIRRGVNEVQSYQDGFKVFHNFVRKNVKDKLTPAEKCGIGVKGNNRWYPILVNSLKQ